jgi:hypothetical protein
MAQWVVATELLFAKGIDPPEISVGVVNGALREQVQTRTGTELCIANRIGNLGQHKPFPHRFPIPSMEIGRSGQPIATLPASNHKRKARHNNNKPPLSAS